MMNRYKVLWFDDKYEEYENDIDTAYQIGIELIGFKNAEEGLIELKNNYQEYDAVIVDGLFYDDSQQVGDPQATAFGKVAQTLRDLKLQGIIIPWFIYSGQPKFIKDKRDWIEVFRDTDFGDGKVYDKTDLKAFETLCDDIIEAASEINSTRIKHKYSNVFLLCNEAYLGTNLKRKLFEILGTVESEDDTLSTEDLFNPLRKVVETLITKMGDLNLLPKNIIESNGWITGSRLFISNLHNEYKHEQEFVPPIIAHTFHRLLDIIQDASHNEGNLKLNVDSYVSKNRSSYLYKSCVFQLLELMLWYKDLKDANPDLEKNKLLWKKLDTNEHDTNVFQGEIEQDANGNYHCGTNLFSYQTIHNKFELGTKVEITKTTRNTNERTKDFYQKFILEFRVL